MPPAFPDPRRWTSDELQAARLEAIADFIAGRTGEGGGAYATFLADATAAVERLFAASNNLRALPTTALVADPALAGPLRYMAGPPISEDDLATMAGVRKSPRLYKTEEAESIIELLAVTRDDLRLPWVDEDRDPTPPERYAAVLTTASLWAAQKMATKRRNESSSKQEAAVRALLAAERFTEVPRRVINAPDDLTRGEFCAQTLVAGSEADVPVRLLNGRLLLIECKVSGSAINSVKRLNGDIGKKLAAWLTAFGAQQITMGVIAGVYKLKNLEDAQTSGIAIVWERDLAPLATFLRAAR